MGLIENEHCIHAQLEKSFARIPSVCMSRGINAFPIWERWKINQYLELEYD